MQNQQKKSFSERLNEKLDEPENEQFKRGKWRWWYYMLFIGEFLCGILTWAIYPDGMMLFVVICLVSSLWWLYIGSLHYSDSKDPKLAQNVAWMDSIGLLFVMIHFGYLLFVYSHVSTLRTSETDFKSQAGEYNKLAEKMSDNQVKVANANRDQARNQATSDFFNSGYGTRPTGKKSSAGSSSNPIELIKPMTPTEASATFLARHDIWIRLSSLAGLLTVALIFIYIRNRSARTNANYQGSSLPSFAGTSIRQPVATGPLQNPTVNPSVATEGLQFLRECLKEISAGLPGRSFKADRQGNGIVIRMYQSQKQRETLIKSTVQSLKIVDPRWQTDRTRFMDRLKTTLKQEGFPI